MKRLINIILIILVVIVACKILLIALPWIIGGILIIGLCGYGYFKYTKRKILKKINKYEEEMNQGTYYNNHVNNGTKVKAEDKNDYDGPIIDVDYEEVNRK